MNKKILVTGANGYIGSKTVKKLLDMGCEVIAVDFSDEHIDKRATIIKTNIFENKNYYELFGRPDVCLHMAWRDGFVHNSINHIQDLSNHFAFVKNLIDSGICQVAVMGTMHEVGYYEGKISELSYTNPQSLYGVAKDALRRSLEIYCKDKQVDFQWLRAFYIFGDDEFGNSIFCKLVRASKEGKELFPFTTGKNKYDFIHVNDLVEQISNTVLQNDICGQINLCTGDPKSLAEQIEWYIKENNLNIKLDYGKYPDRPYDSPCIYGDNEKIQKIMSKKKVK
jgi:dTDP-6-deoxy-L-talose 4-dehydrogenase (NAD+)